MPGRAVVAAPVPLPIRDGVGPTRLRIPASGPWATIAEYVIDRFDHMDADELLRRFDAGEIVDTDGAPISRTAVLGEHEFLWYYRDLPDEAPVPFHEEILHIDDDLVVIDKPHFLPTTPGGRYLQHSALVRLRRRLDNPDIAPIHRLDRPTAGLVMFSMRPETRGAYQSLFERRRVTKVYEAVSALPGGWDARTSTLAGQPFPIVYRNHIESRRGELRVVVDDAREPNAETLVELRGVGVSASGRDVIHTMLRPQTGKTHQLRVHLAALGIGILGDRWYPNLKPETADDHELPLQLLARELEFVDPLTSEVRRFQTRRTLSETPGPTVARREGGGVALTGRLVCANGDEAATVAQHLARHVALTRAEPGCLSFEVAPTDDPLVWTVAESFVDQNAFDEHQARVRVSEWGRATVGIERDYTITTGVAGVGEARSGEASP